MKHILLRLILSVIILITSNSSFYPLAPKSQIKDLQLALPGLGKLGRLLLNIFDDGKVATNLINRGPNLFLEFENLVESTSIRVAGYEYHQDMTTKIRSIIFHIQDQNGRLLNPIMVQRIKADQVPVKIGAQMDTSFGKGIYRGPTGDGDAEQYYQLFELQNAGVQSSKIIPVEVLFKAFILYSARDVILYLMYALPATFAGASSRGILFPKYEDHKIVGIALTDVEIVRDTRATPESLQSDKWKSYRRDLHHRMEQFFVWASQYASRTNDISSLEIFAAMLDNEAKDQLLPRFVLERDFDELGVDTKQLWKALVDSHYINERGQILNSFEALENATKMQLNSEYIGKRDMIWSVLRQILPVPWDEMRDTLFAGYLDGEVEQKFIDVDKNSLREVFAAVGKDVISFEYDQTNEFHVFSHLLANELAQIRAEYKKRGLAVEDPDMVRRVVQILQDNGFLTSILEVDTTTPLWFDFYDFLPGAKGQKREVVFVRIAGESFIIDLSADQYMPKNRADFFAYENGIPNLQGDKVINRPIADFTQLDQFRDAGIVMIPLRYFWQQIEKADFDREGWIDKMLRALAATLAEEEGKEFDADEFVADCKQLFKIDSKAQVKEAQLKLAEKYDLKTLRRVKQDLIPERINRELQAYKFIIPPFKDRIRLLARQFYPYLGRSLTFRKLDGEEIWSDYDLLDDLFDPVGNKFIFFIRGYLEGYLFDELGQPTVVDFTRMPALETAA